jgi:hypothetical protein
VTSVALLLHDFDSLLHLLLFVTASFSDPQLLRTQSEHFWLSYACVEPFWTSSHAISPSPVLLDPPALLEPPVPPPSTAAQGVPQGPVRQSLKAPTSGFDPQLGLDDPRQLAQEGSFTQSICSEQHMLLRQASHVMSFVVTPQLIASLPPVPCDELPPWDDVPPAPCDVEPPPPKTLFPPAPNVTPPPVPSGEPPVPCELVPPVPCELVPPVPCELVPPVPCELVPPVPCELVPPVPADFPPVAAPPVPVEPPPVPPAALPPVPCDDVPP